jgi:hypothetical protein
VPFLPRIMAAMLSEVRFASTAPSTGMAKGSLRLGELCTVKTTAQHEQALLLGPFQDDHEPLAGRLITSPLLISLVRPIRWKNSMLRCMS